ncbi:hypothetical protein PVAG01_05638 [Phlyctema vagabunda]|uniref:Uncharacterized protein n=1 Tax=Phlyctema vagabunda TaxID=108571 RepID=A0ABR4PLS8_9HELO
MDGPKRETRQDAVEKKVLTKGRNRLSQDERMLKGLDKLVGNIYVNFPEPQAMPYEAVKINNYEFVASYSWKDIEHPTIYVPGLPPKFTPPVLPIQLKRDNLKHSKPRSPAAAVDPLFATLLHQYPDFDMSPINLVTDRNSLRKLLSFASNGPGKWRIDVDMINNTMFFNQWEEFRLMMINGHQDTGYGHAFEDCVTTRELGHEDSMHHDRIVKYELGGLQCLVRFEADTYLNADGDSDSEERLAVPSSEAPAPKPSKPVLRPPYKLVHVVSRGHNINSDLIAEIKSCSTVNFKMSQTLPQLWFSQTNYLCIGRHKEGRVTQKLEMKDMREELKKWETNNQENLRRMIRVIREIQGIAKTARKCTIICRIVDGVKCLSVFDRKGGDMAIRPEVVKQCWRTMENPELL